MEKEEKEWGKQERNSDFSHKKTAGRNTNAGPFRLQERRRKGSEGLKNVRKKRLSTAKGDLSEEDHSRGGDLRSATSSRGVVAEREGGVTAPVEK